MENPISKSTTESESGSFHAIPNADKLSQQPPPPTPPPLAPEKQQPTEQIPPQ